MEKQSIPESIAQTIFIRMSNDRYANFFKVVDRVDDKDHHHEVRHFEIPLYLGLAPYSLMGINLKLETNFYIVGYCIKLEDLKHDRSDFEYLPFKLANGKYNLLLIIILYSVLSDF